LSYLLILNGTGVAEIPIAHRHEARSRLISFGTVRAPIAGMTKEELQERSLSFAVAARLFAQGVVAVPDLRKTAQQLIDCSASVAANYRAACRARSRAEFVSKLGTVVEECDEAVYWLEYLARTGLMFSGHGDLLAEAQELRAIFAASYGTARANYKERRR
jgi:four helix bundle protein